MEEGRTEGAQYVTVGEAAKLLAVHRNTIHNRIKSGRIRAHNVIEGDREVYRIELDSLGVGRTSAPEHPMYAQRTIATEELSRLIATRLDKIVRDYTVQLGDLREELGAERARREIAEERAADLEAKLKALGEAREAHGSEASPAPADPPPQPETGAERRSWWRRLFGG